ncbi:hypothetical protein CANARDRAFT_30592 [[Candida] arabinofermentans NRRL YB-2248]|uniref:Phytanoyl-CoA dioxygenase n=1 Tax=[Candida] arabinofermentans NRRL YB-2248 TaxID=983967 RepID=A0A1E4ST94_9ASCO|nr:hypothetical protein CANARDRAFT_30592 [[Candida] arabinofermentans NRRL YB-2248]
MTTIVLDKTQSINFKACPYTKADLPPVKAFTMDSPIEDIIEGMKEAGGCIIRNACSIELLDEIKKEITPFVDADEVWDGDFFPPQTKKASGLIGKAPSSAKALLDNKVYNEVCDAFLTHKMSWWVGEELHTGVSKPQVNNSICFRIGPGASNQPLHRDDALHHPQYGYIDKYPEDLGTITRDDSIGFFIACSKSTKENGATRFIPGSHKWDVGCPPTEELVYHAELEKGDAFIFLASCYHGGSANKTKDEYRLLISCFMTRGYLRQEENQYLAIPMDVIKKLPEKYARMIGYDLSTPYGGWVESKDPYCVVDPTVKSNIDI